MIVESEESDNQILLISHSVDSSITIKEGPLDSSLLLNSDSALIITYKRFEDFSVKNFLVEAFEISLVHNLGGDSTLDYGSVTFAGRQLYKLYHQTPTGAAYQYRSMFVNNWDDSSYAPWSNDFRLERRPLLTSKNSPHITDSEREILTQQPNRIMNPAAGQTISAARDLEIIFSREMVKGTIISIGSYASNSYFHLEMLQSASKLTIPAKYLQSVKGTLSGVKCQVAYDEILFIGSLTAESKTTFQLYLVPIYEFTRGSIMINLTD
jgi:hypothetical protein